MLSTDLVESYARYKRGTKKIVTWLVESTTKSTKTKVGKKSATPAVVVRIPVDRLVDLAKQIVSATDPQIEIPLEILDITKDVLNGRRLCADWYAARSARDSTQDTAVARSNETHK